MNRKHLKGWLKHGDFILLDILCLQICFILSYWLIREFRNPYRLSSYRYQGILLFVCQLILIVFSPNYRGILRRKRIDELFAVVRYIGEIILMAVGYMFITHDSSTASRLQIGSTVILYIILDFTLRQLNKNRVLRSVSADRKLKSIVLITSSRLAQKAVEKLYRPDLYRDFKITRIILLDKTAGESVEAADAWTAGAAETVDVSAAGSAAFADASAARPAAAADVSAVTADAFADGVPEIIVPDAEDAGQGVPVQGLNDESVHELSHEWVDEVFILQPDDMTFPMDLMDALMTMGITVNYTIEAISNDRWPNTDVRKLGDYKVLTNSVRFANAGQLAIKRVIDIAGGLVGCLLTGILYLFIAPAIRRADPGPVFFEQERVGQNGKTFKLHKFRSMYMDAEARKAELMQQNKIKDGMMFKMDDDPRIIGSEKKDKNGKPIGIGNRIRELSLDEFPQFYDVLIGHMSLVGWRPCTLEEWEHYDLQHRIRASMKPGITGMWQVSGRSTITDFDEVVRLDREYIENWNIFLDIRILLKTVWIVLNRKGAS